MGRRERHDHPGAIHHVMNRGVNRQPVFFDDRDRVEFGRRLVDIHQVCGVETLAYCLMDNHYHLLLRSGDARLSEAMQRLGSVYTTTTNRRVGRDGPLFRGRFHSIEVTSDGHLVAAVRYIHRNALDLPGVRSIDQYRWSSMRAHLGLNPAPEFLAVDAVRGLFGDDLSRFAEFHSVPVWNDLFSTDTGAAGADTLVGLIRLAIAADDLRHGVDERLPQHLDRTVAVLLAHADLPPTTVRAARAVAAFSSESARRMALSRARRRLGCDATLRRVVTTIQEHLRSDRLHAA
jgi:REP element-mobilizing transposase RayT